MYAVCRNINYLIFKQMIEGAIQISLIYDTTVTSLYRALQDREASCVFCSESPMMSLKNILGVKVHNFAL